MAENIGESMKSVGKGLLWVSVGILALDYVTGGVISGVTSIVGAESMAVNDPFMPLENVA